MQPLYVSLQCRIITRYPQRGEQICMSNHIRTRHLPRLRGASHIDAFWMVCPFSRALQLWLLLHRRSFSSTHRYHKKKRHAMIPGRSRTMMSVPGLPIIDCVGSCNSSVPRFAKVSTIDVMKKTIFERLYLVQGLGTLDLRVQCPYVPTPPPLTHQLFLDFRAIFFSCTEIEKQLQFEGGPAAVRRSNVPPFFSPGRSDNGILPTPPSSTSPRSDDGILPTPPFYTLLPSTYSLRRSGSSPTRSGLPEKASSTTVPCSSPSTLGAHPLPFSPLPSPHLSPSSPHQASCPRVSSFSSSPPPLLIVGALVTWAIYTQGQLLL